MRAMKRPANPDSKSKTRRTATTTNSKSILFCSTSSNNNNNSSSSSRNLISPEKNQDGGGLATTDSSFSLSSASSPCSSTTPVDSSCYSIESLHNTSSTTISNSGGRRNNHKAAAAAYYYGTGSGGSSRRRLLKLLGCVVGVGVLVVLVVVLLLNNSERDRSHRAVERGGGTISERDNQRRTSTNASNSGFSSNSNHHSINGPVQFDYNGNHVGSGHGDGSTHQFVGSSNTSVREHDGRVQPSNLVSEYVHLYKLPPPLDNDDLVTMTSTEGSSSRKQNQPHPHHHQHHRFKPHDNSRHHYYNTGVFRPPKSRLWDPHPQYIFHAFNRRFHLVLNQISRKHSILVPGFKVTTHRNDNDGGSWASRDGGGYRNATTTPRHTDNYTSGSARDPTNHLSNHDDEFEGCFYNGYVLGDMESSVAVSLCSGMTGHIRTSTGSYFIEPRRYANDLEHEIYQILTQRHGDDHHDKLEESPSSRHTTTSTTGKPYRNHDNGTTVRNLQITPYDYYSDEDYDSEEISDEHEYSEILKRDQQLQQQQHRRSKRSLSTERYVELTVVTDQTMSRYHGDNLKHYVLTLLSIVALVYRDASIGNPINIVLVNFHVLTDTDFSSNQGNGNSSSSTSSSSSGSLHGTSASEMLRNFCKWQKEHNHPDDRHPLHHDTALLLTRETICRNPWVGKCDTLGLAELGTMCDLYASCAIVQDNGLSAAFTIAHELGHVMNMPHDDDYKCQGFVDLQGGKGARGSGVAGGTNGGVRISSEVGSDDFDDDANEETEDDNRNNGSDNNSSGSGGAGGSRKGAVQHFVMSRMLDHNTYPWAWSRCSRHFLTEFLDAGHGYCLEDKPAANLLSNSGSTNDDDNTVDGSTTSTQLLNPQPGVQQPGEIFSEHKQCELVFGPNSQLCSYMPPCRRLWCTNTQESEESEGCRTQHMPWADGTKCGANKWCQRGACVLKDLEKLRVVNGDWGHWQEYGECSRSCGGGVRKSYRECDNPKPRNGGKYCVGPRVRYESCNTFECSAAHIQQHQQGHQSHHGGNQNNSNNRGSNNGTLVTSAVGSAVFDFRAVQCGAHDGDNFNIHGLPDDVVWVPKYNGISPKDRCKLFCRVQGSSSYYLLKEKVIDGTPCGIDTFDICVNGACLPAGCDRRLHSSKTLDICGVCGGDGSTCTTSQGSYNSTKYGYNTVFRIPAGASSIDIRQRSYDNTARDDNYLALFDPVDNEYVLNGHFVVSMFRKTVHYGGSVLEYSGSDQIVERINSSSRPLKRDLEVKVLSVGKLKPPDIVFQYVISSSDGDDDGATDNNNRGGGDAENNQDTYEWVGKRLQGEQGCSSVCSGLTVPYTSFDCVRRNVPSNAGATNQGVVVNDRDCSGIQRPPHRPQPCNTHCTISYKLSCPESCVHARNHTTECFRTLHSTNTTQRISEKYCVNGGVSKPDPPDCVTECRNRKARWRYTQWSECSSSSGAAGRCAAASSSQGNNRSHSSPGHQIRNVWCQRFNWRSLVDPTADNYEVVSDRECEGEKPQARRTCRVPMGVGASTGICGEWSIDQWAPCSTTCGPGRTRALYACVLKTHSNTNILPPDYCGHIQKPVVERPCEVVPCATYATTEWSECECDGTDGGGGRGVETRNVSCVSNGMYAEDHRPCDRLNLPRPEGSRTCVNPDCVVAEYRVSNWSADCRLFNGKHYRYRAVSCDAMYCAGKKPESMLECGEWRVESGWGSCNASCIEVRAVTCYLRGTRVPDETCVGAVGAKPPSHRKCHHNCPGASVRSLRMGGRGEEGYGGGVAPGSTSERSENGFISTTNSYYYYNINGDNSKREDVSSMTTSRSVMYKWVAGAWGKCARVTTSTSGCPAASNTSRRVFKKHRQLKCVAETNGPSRRMTTVPLTYCTGATDPQPDSATNCSLSELSNLPGCPMWVASPDWTSCQVRPNQDENCIHNNVSVYQGLRTRPVACVQDTTNETISISACSGVIGGDPTSIPESEEKCVVKATAVSVRVCTGVTYAWRVGNWSMCVVDGGGRLKCGGKGKKTRTVECIRTWGITEIHSVIVSDELCFSGGGGLARRPRRGRRNNGGGGGGGVGRRPKNSRECSRACKTGSREGRVVGPRPPPFKWVTAEWSNCSKPCGGYGLRHRPVACHRTNSFEWVDPDPLPTQIPSVNNTHNYCAPPKPKEYDYCFVRETCDGDDDDNNKSTNDNGDTTHGSQDPVPPSNNNSSYTWSTSEFTRCNCPQDNSSTFTVSHSFQKRRVFCVSGSGAKIPARHCHGTLKPKRKRKCACNVYKSCAEVRDALVARFIEVQDAEYTLSIGGKVSGVRVYCHGMTDLEAVPKEYVAVNEDTNYSEIYDKRLIRPETCPRNGSRLSSCECVNDKNRRVGFTRWRKVRVNVTNLRVDVDDFTFAYSTQDLIGYATAGDCYSSSMSCPQGRFSIDFRNTGFAVNALTSWTTTGHRATMRVVRKNYGNNSSSSSSGVSHSDRVHFTTSVSQFVQGKCGGYCGTCAVSRALGLRIDVV